MTPPVRLRLSRSAGFDLQRYSKSVNGLPAVNVARPSPWGNPFVIGKPVDQRQAKRWGWWPLANPDAGAENGAIAVRRFRACLVLDEAIHAHVRRELAGKNLACWCLIDPAEPCHADVLLELANRPTCERVG